MRPAAGTTGPRAAFLFAFLSFPFAAEEETLCLFFAFPFPALASTAAISFAALACAALAAASAFSAARLACFASASSFSRVFAAEDCLFLGPPPDASFFPAFLRASDAFAFSCFSLAAFCAAFFAERSALIVFSSITGALLGFFDAAGLDASALLFVLTLSSSALLCLADCSRAASNFRRSSTTFAFFARTSFLSFSAAAFSFASASVCL